MLAVTRLLVMFIGELPKPDNLQLNPPVSTKIIGRGEGEGLGVECDEAGQLQLRLPPSPDILMLSCILVSVSSITKNRGTLVTVKTDHLSGNGCMV